MNQDDIIRLARETGHHVPYAFTLEELERFAALVAAAELRRLHELNTELVNALQLALDAHDLVFMSAPPLEEAWEAWGVEAKARAALAKAEPLASPLPTKLVDLEYDGSYRHPSEG